MTIGELWIEYHSIVSIVLGFLSTFIVFRFVKLNKFIDISLIILLMLLLTGVMGVIKYSGLILIIGLIWFLGFLAIWAIGLLIFAYLSVNYGWSWAWWQIFILGGLWMVLSFIIDLLMNHVSLLFSVRRQLKKINVGDGPYK